MITGLNKEVWVHDLLPFLLILTFVVVVDVSFMCTSKQQICVPLLVFLGGTCLSKATKVALKVDCFLGQCVSGLNQNYMCICFLVFCNLK